MKDVYGMFTMDTIASIAFGVNSDSLNNTQVSKMCFQPSGIRIVMAKVGKERESILPCTPPPQRSIQCPTMEMHLALQLVDCQYYP